MDNTQDEFDALKAENELLKANYEDLKKKAKACRTKLFDKQSHLLALQLQISGLGYKAVEAENKMHKQINGNKEREPITAEQLLKGIAPHTMSDN